jgi:hypothetical protein
MLGREKVLLRITPRRLDIKANTCRTPVAAHGHQRRLNGLKNQKVVVENCHDEGKTRTHPCPEPLELVRLALSFRQSCQDPSERHSLPSMLMPKNYFLETRTNDKH